MGTFIIGDIHGCIDEFKEIHSKIKEIDSSPRIICLGDFFDRGPDSPGCLKYAKENNFESVLGNHEIKFLKFHNKNKDQKYYWADKIDKSDIDYLNSMPTYIKIDNTIIVHAGLRANVDLKDQIQEDMSFIRFINNRGEHVSLRAIMKHGKEAMNVHFWVEDWNGPYSIVYGHYVHSFKNPGIKKINDDVVCYGIDTGCCFGGKLTALHLETKNIIQVDAKKIYCESKYEI